jgi:hypothetical protein
MCVASYWHFLHDRQERYADEQYENSLKWSDKQIDKPGENTKESTKTEECSNLFVSREI